MVFRNVTDAQIVIRVSRENPAREKSILLNPHSDKEFVYFAGDSRGTGMLPIKVLATESKSGRKWERAVELPLNSAPSVIEITSSLFQTN